MTTFSVTYDVLTPESIARGDIAESDYHVENVSLRDALRFVNAPFLYDGGNGCSFYESDERHDMYTGHVETRALHIEGPITAASRRRIARILTGRR